MFKYLSKNILIVVFLVSGILCPTIGKTQTVDTLVNAIEQMSEYFLNRHQDTNYIGNYSDELALKLQTLAKYNYFALDDISKKSSLSYIPVRDLRIGVGVAYKYFAFDINVGLGLENNSEIEDFRSFDFRARLYSSKQFINAYLQYYKGYRAQRFNSKSIKDDSNSIRNDIRTVHLGLEYFYALNYTQFSLKAPFVFNEWQKKSAGSFLFGANFNLFIITSDSSVIPSSIQSQFGEDLHLTNLTNLSLGINAGYMHTFVFKRNIFLTVSLIPGLIFNNGDYSVNRLQSIPRQVNGRVKSLNSLGYNSRRIFAGITYEIDGYWIKLADNQRTEVSHGSGSLFIGYRFKSKAK